MYIKKRVAVCTLLLAILVVVCLSTAWVYADDGDLYHNLDDVAKQSSDEYFIKYRDNYELDTEEMSFFKDTGSVMLNILSSAIFLFQKMLAQLTIAIFSFSLSTDIPQVLGKFLEPFIFSMKGSIWDNLAVYAISFAAFVMLIKVAMNRATQAMSSLIALIMTITLALVFFAYPVKILEGVDLVASGVSNEVIKGPYNQATGGSIEEVEGKAAALCWNLFVHKSWQILEFGSVKTAEKYEADLLKLEPASDKRIEKVKSLADSEGLFSKKSGYQLGRLCSAAILFVFNLALMAIILIFSALIIGYRVLLLFYLLLGVLVFLAALLPGFGMWLVQKWGMRIVSIGFVRVLVVFFLSVTLIFMESIYGSIDEYGLLIVMMLMIVSVVMLWMERYKLLDLFSGYRTTGSFPQTLSRATDTDFNVINAVRVRRNRSESEETSHEGKLPRRKEHQMDKDQRERPSQARTKSAEGARRSKTGAGRGGNGSEQFHKNDQPTERPDQDMGVYFKQAEELLEKQYVYSRTRAEKNTRDDEKPDYDSFVKRTNRVRTAGHGIFDNRDVIGLANLMKATVDRGGSLEDYTFENGAITKVRKEQQRPQSLDSVRTAAAAASNFSGQQTRSPKGINYFKENFGEEQGEEIFVSLQQQYGKETMKNYRPYYNNGGKQSYAQVIKQLNEGIQTRRPQPPQAVDGRTSRQMELAVVEAQRNPGGRPAEGQQRNTAERPPTVVRAGRKEPPKQPEPQRLHQRGE